MLVDTVERMRHVHLRQGIGEAKVATDKQVGTVKQHAEDTREDEVSVSIGGDQARPGEVRVVVTEDQAVVGESANETCPCKDSGTAHGWEAPRCQMD